VGARRLHGAPVGARALVEGRGIRHLIRAWAIFLAAAVLVIALRIRLLDVPLERDEGEYAYAGQLLLQGVPPYAAVYSMKAPGIYAAYAASMAIAGESPRGVHLGLLVANLASMLGLFVLGRRLGGLLAGAIARASYRLMALSASVLRVAA